MSDEQKQKYKENRNKRNKDKYNKMTDEQKQRMKDYQRKYRRIMTDEQKQKSTNKILKTIYHIKNHKYGRLLLNKTRQIVYFNCFVSVFRV